MGTVHLAALIENGRPTLLAQYGQHLTANQRRALDAMARYRTGALGATVMACTGCDQPHVRLKSLGRRHRDLEADLAATAVLHTHTRRLDYHPHLHVIVPGAGVDRS